MYRCQTNFEGKCHDKEGAGEGVGDLEDVPLSCYSSVCCAGEEESGGRGRLCEEVLGSGFNSPGVVVLGYQWDNG